MASIKSGIPNDLLCCTISFRSFPILTVKMPWWKMSNYLKCNIFKMLVLSMPRILISYLVKSSRGRGAKVSVLFYHIRAQRSYGVWAAGGCSRVPTLFGQWVDHGRGCIWLLKRIPGHNNLRRHPSWLFRYHNLSWHPLSFGSTNSSHLGHLGDQACHLLRRRHPQSWSRLECSNVFLTKRPAAPVWAFWYEFFYSIY